MEKYNNSPYRKIPDKLYKDFTMNGKIKVKDYFFNEKTENILWTEEFIQSYIEEFTKENIILKKTKRNSYGSEICLKLFKSFEKYNIKNKRVAVVGSQNPWIEAMLINLKNEVVTIEYNVPKTNYNKLICRDYFEYFTKNKEKFDCIVTFSSIEHSGLGRYGDPLNPNGDIETMNTIYENLNQEGILIWGAPVGKDKIFWNAHRIYGELRLPLIFKNFIEKEWINENKKELVEKDSDNVYQPVVVLTPKKS